MHAADPAVITAAILAGGAGSRLGGRDKGLQPLAGRPLIAHVLAALRPQAGTTLIVANRHRERYAAFAPVVSDAVPGFRGPLAGIAAALAACRSDWLLTAPVDCPVPPCDLARRLWAAARAAGARLAVAHDGTRPQPLFALYARDLAGAAAEALASDLPVWRWQETLGAAVADFVDVPAAFANLNTAADFRRWEQDHA